MDHPEFYKQVLNVIYIVEKPYMYWILPQVRLLVIEGTKTWNITLSHRWRLLGEFLKTWVFPSLRSMTWPTTPFSTRKFLDSYYCYFFILLMFIYLDFFCLFFLNLNGSRAWKQLGENFQSLLAVYCTMLAWRQCDEPSKLDHFRQVRSTCVFSSARWGNHNMLQLNT